MTEVDDIQSFIAAQKRRIEEERAGLREPSVGYRNVSHLNYEKDYKKPEDNTTNITRQEQPKAPKEDISSPSGLPFGSYENVQEKLRKERAEEYKKFLAEKNYRTTGQKSPRDKAVEKLPVKSALKQDYGSSKAAHSNVNPSTLDSDEFVRRPSENLSDQRYRSRASQARPQKTLEELYDAYEELLERKRQDERKYRGTIDDSYFDPRHVRFEDETRHKRQRESWLENGSRRRWDPPERDVDRLAGGRRYSNTDYEDSRTLDDFQERSRGRRQDVPEDRVSRSAPPTAVPLFGEHDMSPEVKQQRQIKYREELQAQMKERELQKKREKNHMLVDDSRMQGTGRDALTNGESGLGRYQPSFPRNEQPRHNQPQRDFQDMTPQRYQPSVPQTDSRLPLNQLAYNQSYNNPYLSQPLNYPGLLSTGPSLSTLNPTADMLNQYPSLLRGPYGGYQPSWATDNTGFGQRTGGLVANLGNTSGTADKNPAVTPRSNAALDESLSNTGFSGFGGMAPTDSGKDRSKQQSYREELTRQMMEKEERKRKDKEDVKKYNLKLERELDEYNPWGKSGGGAPIRDQSGKLVSDLRTMHQYNKEGTIISPRDRTKTVESSQRNDNIPASTEIKSTAVSSPSKVSQFQPSPMQTANDGVSKNSQQEYKEYLRQQVEEKQRKKKEEEDRLREIEEREDKIIQEQQKRLKEEYEKELETAKQKEEAARQKNEELRKAAEEKKKEIERKRLEEDKKLEEKLQKQLDERLKAAKANKGNRTDPSSLSNAQTSVRSSSPPIPTLQKKVEEIHRSASPPIPTLRSKTRSDSPPIPTLQNKEAETTEAVNSRPTGQRQPSVEEQFSRPSSSSKRDAWKPVTPLTYQATSSTLEQNYNRGRRSRPSSATADIDVLSQLTSLRRQLRKEEIKVQQQLSENKEKYVKLQENSGSRRNRKPTGNVFDNVFRKQPSISQKYHDAQSFGAIDEFNKLKYEENSSLHGDFLSQYPEPATSPSTLDLQQKSLLQEQQKRLETFRDKMHGSDKENHQSFGNSARPPSNTSQLESDSQFVPVDDPSQVPQVDSSKQTPRMPSARERRRWKQLENLAKAPKLSDYKPPTPGGFSLNSVTSFNVDELAQKNEERLRRLEAMKQARAESKGDPDEVLKRFIQQHSRPDSKVSENSLPADKRYLPKM